MATELLIEAGYEGVTLVKVAKRIGFATVNGSGRPPREGNCTCWLYPRTDAEGYLWRGTALASWREPTDEPPSETGLQALGKLLRVDPEEALLVLLILPNPKGQLAKPFALPLVTSLELLESLPKVGSGLGVWGELKGRSGRVVVTRAEAVVLSPVRGHPNQASEGPTTEVPKPE